MTDEKKQLEQLFKQLISAPIELFPEFRHPLKAPKKRGVYIIRSPKGTVLHVGRTPSAKDGLYQRLRQHMSGSSSFVIQDLNRDGSQLRGNYWFQCLVVDNRRQRALLEAYAIGQLCPRHIGLG